MGGWFSQQEPQYEQVASETPKKVVKEIAKEKNDDDKMIAQVVVAKEEYPCDVKGCSKVYKTKINLVKHMAAKHPVKVAKPAIAKPKTPANKGKATKTAAKRTPAKRTPAKRTPAKRTPAKKSRR